MYHLQNTDSQTQSSKTEEKVNKALLGWEFRILQWQCSALPLRYSNVLLDLPIFTID